MEERVSIINGSVPLLLVCPHGDDDTNTNVVTEKCAEAIDAYALINHGWKRSDDVDEINSFADCNSVAHIMDTNNFVVNDEYGKEFIKFRQKIMKKWSGFYIFHIHGIGNHIKKKANDNVHLIMGFGKSKKNPSLTCELWVKDAFAKCVEDQGMGNLVIYQGMAGGSYTARKNDNVNQYYRQYTHEPTIQSVQLEVTYDLRDDKQIAEHTGKFLAGCFHQLLSYKDVNPQLNWPTLKEI
tara:strand:+ start:4107 stop:4823 length:717 start_codon:yes stop_codon:yes gene_type:complete